MYLVQNIKVKEVKRYMSRLRDAAEYFNDKPKDEDSDYEAKERALIRKHREAREAQRLKLSREHLVENEKISTTGFRPVLE